ncbi:MAG: hypothetical protein JXJ22_04390 [Bacteroidales bacterium]|nr:hypothetical protein [Bacteroidales bacterium]
MEVRQKNINWLLQGDPSIQYQVHRDLLKSEKNRIEVYRDNILTGGWGKRFLDLQDKKGTWSNGIYSPKWTSTFYTLLTLKRMRAPANEAIMKACSLILDTGFYSDKGINISKTIHRSDTCVTGMFLSIVSHFNYTDSRISKLAEHLFEQQMPDGGWNCEYFSGARHSSFHTTISVLEGLWEYQRTYGKDLQQIEKCRKEAIEFLLQHHLYKSHKTGKTVNEGMLRFSFPPRWRYDIMRALDFMQEINFEKDPRFADAIEVLIKKQTGEGLWKLQNKHAGRIYFDMEIPGQPSRWNTLRALRIMKWWDGNLLIV